MGFPLTLTVLRFGLQLQLCSLEFIDSCLVLDLLLLDFHLCVVCLRGSEYLNLGSIEEFLFLRVELERLA